MRRISPKTKALDLTRFPDGHGLYFDEVRDHVQKHYGMRVADWPSQRIVDDATVCMDMHKRFNQCWNCGSDGIFLREAYFHFTLQAHHIIGGARRSDEFCNIAMLCNECHAKVKTDELPQSKILALKWKYDRANTDWVRLTRLAGRFLPDLIFDEELVR